MKKGIFAIYHGKEYSSGKMKSGEYILRSADRNDLTDGFQECEPFHIGRGEELIVCYKFIDYKELEEYYSIRTMAVYKGFTFEVVDERDGQIAIAAMTGDYREWERLGMECIERGVYQKWIDQDEAEIFIEKQAL